MIFVRLAKPPHYLDRVGVQDFQILNKLADIQLAFPRLDFRDQRLRSLKFTRHFRLGQTGISTGFPKKLPQIFPFFRIQRFAKVLAQVSYLPLESDYPILGIFCLSPTMTLLNKGLLMPHSNLSREPL